jgi:protein SCO1/2
MRGRTGFLAAIVAAAWLAPGCAAAMDEGLPRIGQAPGFNLITQDRQRLSLADLRGKVVVVTFIFASCKDACPLLTAKLATLQPRLGTDFGPRAYFASVTVDPERDTPDVLRRYAEGHGAQLAGWAFLTGTPAEIREVAGRYGVVYKKNRNGDVDHSFLTSVVDQRGMLRVQYVGIRFDPEELLTDIRSLLREGSQ